MADLLDDAIYHILHGHGPGVLSSPRRFEGLLAERVRPSEDRAATLAAVEHGIAKEIISRPDADLTVLSANLAHQSGLEMSVARRTLERWRAAVENLRNGTPPFSNRAIWNVEEKAPPSKFRRAVAAAILVALIGAIAGALPGPLVAIGVSHRNPTAIRARELIERREPPGTRMSVDELAFWTGTLGGFGGLIGGAVGWLSAGFRSPTNSRVWGAIAGATWAFDGAFFGVMTLGLPGLFMGSVIGACAMSFFGAALGWWGLLLLLKPLAWLFVQHF